MEKNITNLKKNLHIHLTQNQNVNGVIHICHGMAEHIGRYKWLTKKLNNDGYHVISIDHRGHGNNITDFDTQGYFSKKDGSKKVTKDLINLLQYSKKNYPNLKKYLIAHSMGSWIALSSLIDGIEIDRIILTGSSYIPKKLIILQQLIVQLNAYIFGDKSESNFMYKITFETYNNYFKPLKTDSDWISSDTENVKAYVNDPLCGFKSKNNLWINLGQILLRVFNKKKYKYVNKDIPIFILSGRDDPVGGFGKGVKRLHKFLAKIFNKVEIEIVDNCRHEVFSERNKENTYNMALNFLRAK